MRSPTVQSFSSAGAPSSGPRRHSMAPNPASLAASLARFDLHSPTSAAPPPPRSPAAASSSALDQAAEKPHRIRILNPLSPHLLGGLPSAFTRQRLRDWGTTYLGNASSADVFVRAVAMGARRGSGASGSGSVASVDSGVGGVGGKDEEGDDHVETVETTRMLRVRIQPAHENVSENEKGRKSFVLQKKFNLAARTASPRAVVVAAVREEKGREKRWQRKLRERRRRRSVASISLSPSRDGERGRASVQSARGRKGEPVGLPATQRDGEVETEEPQAWPMHVEYTLTALPLLGAILLSGHVLRGDAIELPLPRPEAWEDVVVWAYTGKIADGGGEELREGVRECVEYLGGRMG